MKVKELEGEALLKCMAILHKEIERARKEY